MENKFTTFLTEIKIQNGSGLNEEITLHPSSIPSHFSLSILAFLSKRSEEVLLIFFRVFGNFKTAQQDGNKFIILCDRFCCFS